MKLKIPVIIIFLYSFTSLGSEKPFVIVKDFKPDWKVTTNGMISDSGTLTGRTKTIYLSFHGRTYRGSYLKIESPLQFSVFIDGRLANDRTNYFLASADSLMSLAGKTDFFVAIHQEKGVDNLLTTQMIAFTLEENNDNFGVFTREKSYFKNFVVIVAILLLIYIVMLVRLHPRLFINYFSIVKLFSLREADDSQLHSRIFTSSTVLFYLFASLLLSFYFMFIKNSFEARLPVLQSDSFIEITLLWLVLSALFFGFVIAKGMLVLFFSRLFKFNDLSGFHFFNFVRVLLLVWGGLTMFAVFYFLVFNISPTIHSILLYSLKWTLIVWSILALFKILGRRSHSAFNLFSYICATEIIPLGIIIKVLYQ